MSIDIDWARLTTGPEGLDLAASIRDFIHDKFQQVTLPRFIRSVHVHSFEFGDQCPDVEIKDIGDPWEHFYEDEDDGSSGSELQEIVEGGPDHIRTGDSGSTFGSKRDVGNDEPARERQSARMDREVSNVRHAGVPIRGTTRKPANLPLNIHSFPRPTAFSAQNSPGLGAIPGGTSNLSYFHLPLNHTGLRSGSHTPLPFSPTPWGPTPTEQLHHYNRPPSPVRTHQPIHAGLSETYLKCRPTTSGPDLDTRATSWHDAAAVKSDTSGDPESETDDDRSQDLQTTLHITYNGNLSLSLTAEILLDYPMPNFVGIPLALKITGMSFDGVALLAYMNARKRKNPSKEQESVFAEADASKEDAEGDGKGKCHFSFLTPEDAKLIIGNRDNTEAMDGLDCSTPVQDVKTRHAPPAQEERRGLGALLREIKVETEIGRQENGKQVLKNVGKVEKFVIEQMRRIFEEEFVWPSFWTFLV